MNELIANDLPPILRTIDEVRQWSAAAKERRERVGFVPTMGALHEGHLSLVCASRAECERTIVSIYVNPSQFAPHEDFERYPRPLDSDLRQLAQLADAVFVPDDAEIYPPGFATWVEPYGAAEPLEGERRPGHFRGVATVVLKLFQIVGPDVAYFGQKDFQQLRVIEQMRDDFHLPVEIRRCPIVREPDGLAMSSRNRYLSAEGRRKATALVRALEAGRTLVAQGERAAAAIEAAVRGVLLDVAGAEIDYVALVDPVHLRTVERTDAPTLCALAVRIDNTRLIDNTILVPPKQPGLGGR